MWGRSRFFVLAVILAGMVHLFCFAYVSRNPRAMFTLDSAEYIRAAHNLARSGVLYSGDFSEPLNPELYSRRPPVYPLFITAAWEGWEDVRGVVALQIGLTLISGWLLWVVLGWLNLGTGMRLATTGVFFFYPAQIIYTHVLMPEVLLQFFVLLAIVALVRFLKSGAAGWLWVLNAALSLAVMTKPILLFFWAPNLLFLIWVAARRRRAVLILAGLLPLLVQSAWSYRNQRLTGTFHFSSMSAQLHRYLVNKYVDESRSSSDEPDRRESTEGGLPSLFRIAIEHPVDMAQRHLAGMASFFLDPGRFDFQQFFDSPYSRPGFSHTLDDWIEGRRAIRGTGRLLYVLIGLGLFNLGVAAAFLLFPFQPVQLEFKVFLCLIVLYMATATAAYGRSRYRLPVMPELLLAAAVILDQRRRPAFRAP